MDLYLMRHGIAEWPAGAWKDEDDKRPLTPEGIQEVQLVSETLASLNLHPQLILHSPLIRAAETARFIGKVLALPGRVKEYPALRPGFDVTRLKYLLRETAQAEELIVVGHMPDMAQAVKVLTGGEVRFAEATVAYLKVSKPAEQPSGVLIWLAPAALLSRVGRSK